MGAIFDFYSITAKIEIGSPRFQEMTHLLKDDFYFFLRPPVPSNQEAHVTFNLIESTPPVQQPKLPLFKTKMAKVSGLGKYRHCEYGNGITIVSTRRGAKRYFKIYIAPSAPLEEAYEICYTAILSAVGEELDLIGYHRIHALGFTYESRSNLLLLPSGGGKSTLAAILKQIPSASIFSDEMPLLRKGIIYPFPIRIALNPKIIRELPIDSQKLRPFKRRLYPQKLLLPLLPHEVSSPERLNLIFVGRTNAAQSEIVREQTLYASFNLFMNLVVGLGLCQMAEHMVRTDNLFRLLKIALSRFLEAFRLVRMCEIKRFNLSRDSFENISTMESFFSSNPR